MNIEMLFAEMKKRDPQPDCLTEHMDDLRALASRPDIGHITEFGCRNGFSTTAWLSAPFVQVVSYDHRQTQFAPPADVADRWQFIQHDTAKLESIETTDLLFVDTAHTVDQVRAETRLCITDRVRRFIAFHDTVEWGCRHEPQYPPGVGICTAIFEFLVREWRTWRVYAHTPKQNGMTVIERISR